MWCWYLDQSYFDILKRSVRTNSNNIIVFKQTLKDVGHMWTTAGLDKSIDAFTKFSKRAWKDDSRCLKNECLKVLVDGGFATQNKS